MLTTPHMPITQESKQEKTPMLTMPLIDPNARLNPPYIQVAIYTQALKSYLTPTPYTARTSNQASTADTLTTTGPEIPIMS